MIEEIEEVGSSIFTDDEGEFGEVDLGLEDASEEELEELLNALQVIEEELEGQTVDVSQIPEYIVNLVQENLDQYGNVADAAANIQRDTIEDILAEEGAPPYVRNAVLDVFDAFAAIGEEE